MSIQGVVIAMPRYIADELQKIEDEGRALSERINAPGYEATEEETKRLDSLAERAAHIVLAAMLAQRLANDTEKPAYN